VRPSPSRRIPVQNPGWPWRDDFPAARPYVGTPTTNPHKTGANVRTHPEHHRQRPGQGRLRPQPERGRVPRGPPTLREADVGSVVRRAPALDVPEFLAAGPRDVLVAPSDVHIATDVLHPGEPEPPSQMRRDRRSRVLAGLLIGAALVGLVVCVAAGVFG
jgi:hypothetical protein